MGGNALSNSALKIAEASGSTFAVVWGTDIYAATTTPGSSSNTFGGALIKSIRNGERNSEHSIENGAGITAIFILLKDGCDFEISLVDNATLTSMPTGGDVLTFLNPLTGTATATALCLGIVADVERKREGGITISAKQFTLLNVF